ncbi:hypothetical protein CONLIGDRAFT_717629 [Coniochaeta ligniaria NRRL 30616]|uniref:DUF4267 domain-containing protein n=1 Tax=Coniochaeta ligniaria NRRL 30616 TaxID=1408157 RepID=A0A1J7JEF2_9PEZI|nr:hypothetical protein CONLIGDRAFT_717629 [Coniochaeta ligniaria NRRL 30616]
MPYLQPSTWRILGLSVGAGYAGFGVWMALFPRHAAKTIFGYEGPESTEAGKMVSLLHQLLGSRDLTLAATIFIFLYRRQEKAAGMVIVSGTTLCYADAIGIYVRRGFAPALQLFTGASIWAAVGFGLMSSTTERVIKVT